MAERNFSLRVAFAQTAQFPIIASIMETEYIHWSSKYTREYIESYLNSDKSIAGILIATNEADYCNGFLTYRIQPTRLNLNLTGLNDFKTFLNITDLLCSNTFFCKTIMFSLFNKAIEVCELNNCHLLKIPKIDDLHQQIKPKFKDKIIKEEPDSTFLKI